MDAAIETDWLIPSASKNNRLQRRAGEDSNSEGNSCWTTRMIQLLVVGLTCLILGTGIMEAFVVVPYRNEHNKHSNTGMSWDRRKVHIFRTFLLL